MTAGAQLPIHAQVESVSFSPIPVGHCDRDTWQVTVDLRHSRDGVQSWAVRISGRALNTETGEFDYEPIPSERTDDWLATHRFSDYDAACRAAMEAAPGVTWNGRSAAQIAAAAAG